MNSSSRRKIEGKLSSQIESRQGLLEQLRRAFDPRNGPVHPYGRRETASELMVLALVLIVLCGPFLTTAFHIDDPLFIWAAGQIRLHPMNPYGFLVNWYGSSMPMSEVTKNPPLTSYYIAIVTSLFGWSEPALHIAFLAPAIGLAVGVYLLARRLCSHPLFAALSGILTPVFLVSSVTVMSDVLMLFFWVMAVYLWIRGTAAEGIGTRRHWWLAAGGVSIGAAALSKYFGMALLPLLFVYTIFRKRRFDWGLLYFAIPYSSSGRNIWYTGHWGFQYYMEMIGAKAFDLSKGQVAPGDIVVVPTTNTNVPTSDRNFYPLQAPSFRQLASFDVPLSSWVSTMNPAVGAGFYAEAWGPLPFTFAPVPSEHFTIFEVQ